MSDNELNFGMEKNSSKMIWIIVGSVFGLVLLVIGTLYWMGRLPVPDFMTEAPKTADSSGSEQGGHSIYHPLEPFVVNFREGDGTRFMQVTMTALVRSQEVVSAIEKHDPVIRNNLLLLLAGQDPVGLRTRKGKEGLRLLVLQEMQEILARRTGDKGIEEIFFTGFVMQ